MINKIFTIKGLILVLVLASGCSKEQNDTPAPVANSVGTADAKEVFGWAKFIAEIEAGTKKDPSGQFVSKDTKVANGDGKTVRATRPKNSKTSDQISYKFPQPVDPCDGCPTGTPEPSTAFFSSLGVGMNLNPVENPNNYILNLDIIKGDADFGLDARQGFIKIPVNLNKGAGGKTIYLCYTRQSSESDIAPLRVYDPEGGLAGPNTAATYTVKQPITDISVTTHSFFGTTNPVRSTGYDWVYQYTGTWPYYWTFPDLNDEAGGKYIYATFTKGLPTSGAIYGLPQNPIKEVGVIYSTDSNVPTPAGWEIVRRDLNEDAGGYYIYICYKH